MPGHCSKFTLLPLLIYAVVISRLEALDITDVSIPPVVLNGSTPFVILDCKYLYERYEASGLEVKWFRNGDPEPIYQWIPGKNPKALGILKERIDPEHISSEDKNARHRAIKLLRPTIDLTGNYTCRISSFHDEESKTRTMIVYAPVEEMNMTFSPTAEGDSIWFLCEASAGFPRPRLDLFISSDSRRERLKPSKEETVEDENGGFNTTIEATLSADRMLTETLVLCELTIPGTNFKMRRQIIYFPVVSGAEDSKCQSKIILITSIHLLIALQLFIKYLALI